MATIVAPHPTSATAPSAAANTISRRLPDMLSDVDAFLHWTRSNHER
jgi:hypothetical protein